MYTFSITPEWVYYIGSRYNAYVCIGFAELFGVYTVVLYLLQSTCVHIYPMEENFLIEKFRLKILWERGNNFSLNVIRYETHWMCMGARMMEIQI